MPFVTSVKPRVPGREIWKPFEGQEYTIFIDESFYKFFDFAHQDGTFAHGAVGLPTTRYDAFQQSFAIILAKHKKALKAITGSEPNELKNTDLYKLPFNIRRRLILQLTSALAAHGAFVAGFYTSNRGLVMEEIRESLLGKKGVTAVPADHAKLYEETVKTLNDAVVGPGMSAVISKLLFLPVMAMIYFLSDLNCSFRIVYDPRQATEDVAVKKSIEETIGAIKNAESLGVKAKFSGLQIDKPSHEEVGLQVADFVAGEVRRFFRCHPEFLSAGSNLNLITFEHQDGEIALLGEAHGRTFKKGRQVPIPTDLLKKAFRATEDTALPYVRNLLAAGMITCITEFGTERDVALFDSVFLDLCD